jgi:endonuclease/exonuclease/phosphatase family protein
MPYVNLTWWNLQNFFDTDDDPISADFEYTPANGWTEERFRQKRANLAAALKATHGGEGPHLLAVAEIEKDGLLAELIATMGPSNLKVAVDPAGTQDLRGIDVAVAYDEALFEVVSQQSHVVHFRYRTRDIFELVLRFKPTGELLTFIPSHWPSRSQGRYETEPLRIAVAENIGYLVDGHLKLSPAEYEGLRASGDFAPVRARWERKLMVVGDFNDEPFDRSVTEHLKASKDFDFVTGERNDLDRFSPETADYRAEDAILFNATAHLAGQPTCGSYYLAGNESGKTTNPFQLLDQLVISRGLAKGPGLRLERDSVGYFNDRLVATPGLRPRAFDRKTGKGTSDHLPLVARLIY